MRIVVYSKPDCVQCFHTKRILTDELGLIFTDIDVTKDRAAEKDARKMGEVLGRTLPIVVVSYANGQGQQSWAGLKVDMLRALVPPAELNAGAPDG